MAIDFFDPKSTTIRLGQFTATDKPMKETIERLTGGIASSKDLTGIEIRMLPPFIVDNHTTPVWPFPGFSKLYCLTIVVSDVSNQLAGTIDLKGFPRIGDQEFLPINKTIYYWQSAKPEEKGPSQIHIMTSVIKSKQDLRDVGKILSDVKKDENYKSLIETLAKTATDASGMGVALDIVGEIAGLVGKYMGNVQDKPIGTTINSYTSLYGDFDQTGINKRKISSPHVNFEFDLVVRDKSRMAERSRSRSAEVDITESEEKVEVEMTPLN